MAITRVTGGGVSEALLNQLLAGQVRLIERMGRLEQQLLWWQRMALAGAPDRVKRAELIEAVASAVGIDQPFSAHAIEFAATVVDEPGLYLRSVLVAMELIGRRSAIGHALGALAESDVVTATGLRIEFVKRESGGRLWVVTRRMPNAD